MQSQVLQEKMSVPERTNKVREAFKKATPEAKSKVFELVPFPMNLETSSNDVICQWDQAWDQSWPQWGQSHW